MWGSDLLEFRLARVYCIKKGGEERGRATHYNGRGRHQGIESDTVQYVSPGLAIPSHLSTVPAVEGARVGIGAGRIRKCQLISVT